MVSILIALGAIGALLYVEQPRALVSGVGVRARFGAQAIGQIVIAVGILAILALAGLVVAQPYYAITNARVCAGNISDIVAAAKGFYLATNTYPATTTKVIAGATGTFAVSGATSDFLSSTPVDPVNPTGFYSWTYTPATVSAPDLYVVTCPGIHPSFALKSFPGSGPATGKLQYSSSGGMSAI